MVPSDSPDLQALAALVEDQASLSRMRESKRAAKDIVARLSAPEKLLLTRMAAGWSSGDAACELQIPIAEFNNLRSGLLEKLSARSTADAVRTALLAGLY